MDILFTNFTYGIRNRVAGEQLCSYLDVPSFLFGGQNKDKNRIRTAIVATNEPHHLLYKQFSTYVKEIRAVTLLCRNQIRNTCRDA